MGRMGLNQRLRCGIALLGFLSPLRLSGQAVRGTPVDGQSGIPLKGATVVAHRAGRAATSDILGHFTLQLGAFPDTLIVLVIGRTPTHFPLDRQPDATLIIHVSSEPITLSELIVTAPAGAVRPIEDVGRWQLDLPAARRQPAAIEADVFRALALIPAVSFSTPLSARPIVRGYDAGESSIRIDGFEVFNLYHIGRAFSAFPADAVDQVSVSAPPGDMARGGALAGSVDITGRQGDTTGLHGGIDLSLASASIWTGGGSSSTQWFAAARAVHFSALDVFSDSPVPYGFQDLYSSVRVGRTRFTAFASRDHLFDRGLGSGMDWTNVLIGGRWMALDDGSRTVHVSASATRFSEALADVPARFSRIDARNRFERASLGVDGALSGAHHRLEIGAALALRAIGNRITPRSGEDFVARDTAFNNGEIGAYGAWTIRLRRAALQLGARVDIAGTARALQPRLRLSIPISDAVALSVGAGRAARLYHLVSDPQSEPNVVFYDFWLTAGQAGIPIPVSDHAAVDVDVARANVVGRLSVFASRSRGLLELRPSSDQRAAVADPFRQGRGRNAGLELQIALRGTRSRQRAISATYVLSVAQRDWGLGWIPWSQDRRHGFRLAGGTQWGRWSLFGSFEAMSGAPLTPVDGVILISRPDPNSGGLVRDIVQPAYVFGREHSRRSAGTARVDFGANRDFRGPWRSRMTLGLSVVNAGFGPVAPLQPAAPGFDPGVVQRGQVRYKRLFDMPAIPSITLRMEF